MNAKDLRVVKNLFGHIPSMFLDDNTTPQPVEQVQSDWNQYELSAPDFIKNRTHYAKDFVRGYTNSDSDAQKFEMIGYGGDTAGYNYYSDDNASITTLEGRQLTFINHDDANSVLTTYTFFVGGESDEGRFEELVEGKLYACCPVFMDDYFLYICTEDCTLDDGEKITEFKRGYYFLVDLPDGSTATYYMQPIITDNSNVKQLDDVYLPSSVARISQTGGVLFKRSYDNEDVLFVSLNNGASWKTVTLTDL